MLRIHDFVLGRALAGHHVVRLEFNYPTIVYYLLLASAGNQFGTPVTFLADAPARYNAWDEFVLYRFIVYSLCR